MTKKPFSFFLFFIFLINIFLGIIIFVPQSVNATTLVANQDVFVKECDASSNFDGTGMWVGTANPSGTECSYRSLVDFDLSSYTMEYYIESATFRIYPENDVNVVGRTWYIFNCTSTWNQVSVTWNSQPTYSGTQIDSHYFETGLGGHWVEFDVASYLQDYFDNDWTFYGIMIRDNLEDASIGETENALCETNDYGTHPPELVITLHEKHDSYLQPTWNFIAFPFNNTFTSYSLYNYQIPNCTSVNYYNPINQEYDIFNATEQTNFQIQNNVGYMISVDNHTNITWDATNSITEWNVSIYQGWNYLGWISDTNTNARAIGNMFYDVDTVLYYNENIQDFIGHPVGTFINNFTISKGMGFAVHTNTQQYWNETDVYLYGVPVINNPPEMTIFVPYNGDVLPVDSWLPNGTIDITTYLKESNNDNFTATIYYRAGTSGYYRTVDKTIIQDGFYKFYLKYLPSDSIIYWFIRLDDGMINGSITYPSGASLSNNVRYTFTTSPEYEYNNPPVMLSYSPLNNTQLTYWDDVVNRSVIIYTDLEEYDNDNFTATLYYKENISDNWKTIRKYINHTSIIDWIIPYAKPFNDIYWGLILDDGKINVDTFVDYSFPFNFGWWNYNTGWNVNITENSTYTFKTPSYKAKLVNVLPSDNSIVNFYNDEIGRVKFRIVIMASFIGMMAQDYTMHFYLRKVGDGYKHYHFENGKFISYNYVPSISQIYIGFQNASNIDINPISDGFYINNLWVNTEYEFYGFVRSKISGEDLYIGTSDNPYNFTTSDAETNGGLMITTKELQQNNTYILFPLCPIRVYYNDTNISKYFDVYTNFTGKYFLSYNLLDNYGDNFTGNVRIKGILDGYTSHSNILWVAVNPYHIIDYEIGMISNASFDQINLIIRIINESKLPIKNAKVWLMDFINLYNTTNSNGYSYFNNTFLLPNNYYHVGVTHSDYHSYSNFHYLYNNTIVILKLQEKKFYKENIGFRIYDSFGSPLANITVYGEQSNGNGWDSNITDNNGETKLFANIIGNWEFIISTATESDYLPRNVFKEINNIGIWQGWIRITLTNRSETNETIVDFWLRDAKTGLFLNASLCNISITGSPYILKIDNHILCHFYHYAELQISSCSASFEYPNYKTILPKRYTVPLPTESQISRAYTISFTPIDRGQEDFALSLGNIGSTIFGFVMIIAIALACLFGARRVEHIANPTGGSSDFVGSTSMFIGALFGIILNYYLNILGDWIIFLVAIGIFGIYALFIRNLLSKGRPDVGLGT